MPCWKVEPGKDLSTSCLLHLFICAIHGRSCIQISHLSKIYPIRQLSSSFMLYSENTGFSLSFSCVLFFCPQIWKGKGEQYVRGVWRAQSSCCMGRPAAQPRTHHMPLVTTLVEVQVGYELLVPALSWWMPHLTTSTSPSVILICYTETDVFSIT